MSALRVVVGILKKGDKVLVAKRSASKPYSGYWEFPGGKIEHDESNFDALCRELNEELGIVVTGAHPWFMHFHDYPDKTVYLDMWLVEAFQGVPAALEHDELQWVSLTEMSALKILDGNWPILEKLKTLF